MSMDERLRKNLRRVLEDMDVPVSRLQLRPEDLAWLRRNLGVMNADHPNFGRARHLLGSI